MVSAAQSRSVTILRATEGNGANMRKLDALLNQYGETHQNPVNKAIHWVCVPLIMWSALAAMWILSPIATCIFVALALVYYARMSLAMAVGMLAMAALMIIPVPLLGERALWIAATVFVLAWVGQFVGHAIEGKRPKFLQDLQFLLIGPAWILRFVYRGVGIRY
jgi:uncharacterized membrane protein YGL010W